MILSTTTIICFWSFLTWPVLTIDNTEVVLRVKQLEELLRRNGLHGLPKAVAVLGLELLGVDDHLLQLPLRGGPFDDLLVDGAGGDEAVDHHRLGLADTVAPILRLKQGNNAAL